MSCIALNRGVYFYVRKGTDEVVTPYFDVQAQATTHVMQTYRTEYKEHKLPGTDLWPQYSQFKGPDAYKDWDRAYKAYRKEFAKYTKARVAELYELRSGKLQVVPHEAR
jgi:hypothetical protein